MTLIIYCIFDDGPQMFWKVNATGADLEDIRNAMSGNPGETLSFVARVNPNGEDKERLFRAGAIRSVDVERD
jgi:hypothetical protein